MTIFQKSIIEAQELHHAVKKNAIGQTTFDKWEAVCGFVSDVGYTAWCDTHDNMGHEVAAEDKEVAHEHREAVKNALVNAVEIIGEVEFMNGGAAKLDISKDLIDATIAASWVFGWRFSKEVQDIDKLIIDAKYDAQEAEKEFNRYDFNGVNEDAKKAKKAAWDEKQAIWDNLNEQRKTAINKPNGKRRAPLPKIGDAFRMDFECLIADMLEQRKSITYAAYVAEREALKELKRAKKRAKKNSK